MAIKNQKNTSFHSQWRLHLLLSYTRGYRNRSRAVWWQTPDARTRMHPWLAASPLDSHDVRVKVLSCIGEVLESFGLQHPQPPLNHAGNPLSVDYNGVLVRPDLLIRHRAPVKDGEEDSPNSVEHQREWTPEEQGHPNTAVTEIIKSSQGQVNTRWFCWCSSTPQGRKHSHPGADRQNPQQVQPADGRELLSAQLTALKVAVLTCQ